MLHIAVCDRDALFCKSLEQKINECFCNYNINILVECFFDEQILLRNCKAQTYNYIFLGIYNLLDETYIDITNLIQKQESTKMIFVTSYNEIVFDALRFPIYYFIRKAELEKDLEVAIFKIKDDLAKKSKYYLFQLKNSIEKVLISDIVYIESFKHTILVHCTNRDLSVTNNTLTRLYEQLSMYNFFQIHKSYIVNLFFITAINKTDIVLNDKITLQISRYRKTLLVQKFDNYIRDLGWLK